MLNIEGRLYDWKTQFNAVPVQKINAVWSRDYGDGAGIALMYKDGKFTGAATPLGARTLEEVTQEYRELCEADETRARLQTPQKTEG